MAKTVGFYILLALIIVSCAGLLMAVSGLFSRATELGMQVATSDALGTPRATLAPDPADPGGTEDYGLGRTGNKFVGAIIPAIIFTLVLLGFISRTS